MEPGQLVTRYNHMLHPLFCYHHQVSDTPADVVSAHGQGKSCEQGGMKQRKAEKEKKKQKKYQLSKGIQFATQVLTVTSILPIII